MTTGTGQENRVITCLICQSPIEPTETKSTCPSCKREYHSECWEQNKGCAVYGCPQVPPAEPVNELEIPTSYWGKEKKICPSCEKEILAASLRCSHCGTIFSDARPFTREEFQEEQDFKDKKKALQLRTILIVIFNILTFTAPFAAFIGFFWYRAKKKELKSLPHLYLPLIRIGLAVGILQTILIILFGIIFSIFN